MLQLPLRQFQKINSNFQYHHSRRRWNSISMQLTRTHTHTPYLAEYAVMRLFCGFRSRSRLQFDCIECHWQQHGFVTIPLDRSMYCYFHADLFFTSNVSRSVWIFLLKFFNLRLLLRRRAFLLEGWVHKSPHLLAAVYCYYICYFILSVFKRFELFYLFESRKNDTDIIAVLFWIYKQYLF